MPEAKILSKHCKPPASFSDRPRCELKPSFNQSPISDLRKGEISFEDHNGRKEEYKILAIAQLIDG
jgi:hypothetical protein